MKYGEHYTWFCPGNLNGEYKIKILWRYFLLNLFILIII